MAANLLGGGGGVCYPRAAPMRRPTRWISGVLSLALTGFAVGAATGRPTTPLAQAAYAQQCGDPFPATRNPSNPLMLASPPGANPLHGARFFVDGPRHGEAAGAIARLLGLNPERYRDSYSWARFRSSLDRGRIRRKLLHQPRLAYQVHMLEKIASQPEEQRFSLYSEGGGPGAIYGQVQKIFCHNLTADPGSIPLITTFFLYQAGYCESRDAIVANAPRFDRQIDEMVAGIGRRPAVVLLELDAIGTAKCAGSLAAWESDLRYEIQRVSSLPHVVAYVEGGYADGNPPGYTARVLNAIGGQRIQGFFVNDGHNDWTINAIRWAARVSRLTHGMHVVVNTSTNGRGPKLNPHPVTQGIEDLCNPPGRGMGPRPTTSTGFGLVDAFVWTGVPGNSSGGCRGGPPAGSFWMPRAVQLAAHAQAKLGPGFPAGRY